MTCNSMQFIQKEGYEKDFMWPVVIAGGALRDSWYDKEPVDVDIFIGMYKSTIEKALEDGFFYVNRNYSGEINDISLGDSAGIKFFVDTGEHASGAPGTLFVSGRSHTEAPGINIILHEFEEGGEIPDETDKMVAKMFEEFPASISKIAYSPTLEKWYVHPDFEETERTNIIKCKMGITSRYTKKLWPKYDGFRGAWY